jgi:arylsulfatase A-like enzyme
MFPTACRPRGLLAPLAFAVLLAGCGGPATDSGEQPLNVVLISIDSLRADHLGCYGYDRETSPAIDALARDGVLFEQVVSQAPWTLPSHASLMTSLYGRTHQTNDVSRRLPADIPTLASVLAEAGYSTRAIVAGTFMQSRFGLDSGFQIYDDTLARVTHRRSHESVTSPTTHERALELLNSAPEPFFLFLHYWDVHYDYIPPDPYDTMFDPDYSGPVTSSRFMKNRAIHPGMDPADLAHIVALYDGEIRWVDEHIDMLLDSLHARGLDERTIVVLTSDHGDEFFEHGERGHSHSLYEELVRVPLIMRVPGAEGGRRVRERVELIDVMPTVLELAGVPFPAGIQGRTLGPALQGAALEQRACFTETNKSRKTKDEELRSDSWAVVDGGHKLIAFGDDRFPSELFDLESDPGETENRYGEPPTERLLELHRAWLERIPTGEGVPNEGVDEATLEELRGLGYVGND